MLCIGAVLLVLATSVSSWVTWLPWTNTDPAVKAWLNDNRDVVQRELASKRFFFVVGSPRSGLMMMMMKMMMMMMMMLMMMMSNAVGGFVVLLNRQFLSSLCTYFEILRIFAFNNFNSSSSSVVLL